MYLYQRLYKFQILSIKRLHKGYIVFLTTIWNTISTYKVVFLNYTMNKIIYQHNLTSYRVPEKLQPKFISSWNKNAWV